MTYQKIEYIESVALFNEAIAHLQSADSVAFDLEFDSNRYSYGFTLCLIQICTRTRCFIIDPFKIQNIKPLFEVFENPKILKIAHSVDQDLRLLHSLKCYPQEVCDTDIIGKLLNYEVSSLAHFLHEKLQVQMDKKLQASNWTLRPLSEAQILYAAHDVIYLFDLYETLMKEVFQKGIMDWVKDETSAHNEVRFDEQTPNTDFLSKNDKKDTTEFQQFVLNELLKFREGFAQKYNKPPYQIIDNQLLREMVKGEKSFEDWLSYKSIYKAVKNTEIKNAFYNIYTNAIKEAKALELNMYGKRRLTPEERAAAAQLLAERDEIKQKLFKPIQSIIIDRYGLFTSRYLLSEGFINNVVRQHIKLSELHAPYRRNIILNIAQELDINLSAYW